MMQMPPQMPPPMSPPPGNPQSARLAKLAAIKRALAAGRPENEATESPGPDNEALGQ